MTSETDESWQQMFKEASAKMKTHACDARAKNGADVGGIRVKVMETVEYTADYFQEDEDDGHRNHGFNLDQTCYPEDGTSRAVQFVSVSCLDCGTPL